MAVSNAPDSDWPYGVQVGRKVDIAVGDSVWVSAGDGLASVVELGCGVAVGKDVLVGHAVNVRGMPVATIACAEASIFSGLSEPDAHEARNKKENAKSRYKNFRFKLTLQLICGKQNKIPSDGDFTQRTSTPAFWITA